MSTNRSFSSLLQRIPVRRGMLFGLLIVTALLAFEIFNYSTTDFALSDLLGDLKFAGVRWATILAIAFCGIDFAGIARLFTPEQGADEPAEVWYLFGAWLLAATMNAMLTWWGVSIAILNQDSMGSAVIEHKTLLRIVPVFVAIMVWLIRILIIGTFSVAGERLFSESSDRRSRTAPAPLRSLSSRPAPTLSRPATSTTAAPLRTLQRPAQSGEANYTRAEPTYHPVGMQSRTESTTHPIRH